MQHTSSKLSTTHTFHHLCACSCGMHTYKRAQMIVHASHSNAGLLGSRHYRYPLTPLSLQAKGTPSFPDTLETVQVLSSAGRRLTIPGLAGCWKQLGLPPRCQSTPAPPSPGCPVAVWRAPPALMPAPAFNSRHKTEKEKTMPLCVTQERSAWLT